MELTRGVLGAIPITVVPFEGGDNAPQSVSSIVANDLQNSGRFKLSKRGGDYVVVGRVARAAGDRYQVSFALREDVDDQGSGKTLLHRDYTVSGKDLRAAAHHVSDAVYQAITGTRGVFSTKIAYVLIQHDDYGRKRYLLEVADQDGYNPKPLLNSPEPIMSPSWAPNGKQIAYVSFEHRQAGIYLQNVMTGERMLVSRVPGINGAPAFSPDGRKLAIVLSTSGTPNIYIMDLASHHLTPVTHDFYINTEPAWSPSGRSLIFTSNRSGGPQIYQVNLQSHATTRLTYDGNYNARGSYTPDGKHVVMIHVVSGIYSIGILDLDSGALRILSSRSADSASPSIAPNGSMVLYDMVSSNRNVLGMVSSDGRIQLVMPAREGDAQDPAWSPYLT
jgi:TolB protein